MTRGWRRWAAVGVALGGASRGSPDLSPPEIDGGLCDARFEDRDSDGLPDCADLDVNGDGVADADTPLGDLDADGFLDALDPDIDGDGIRNQDELDARGRIVDSDGDGLPDLRDRDSDDDGIPDAVEGPLDFDADGLENFRDRDSDGDRLADTDEVAPDGTPTFCQQEIDPWFDLAGGRAPELEPDLLPDFLDRDSDNDGLPDGDEEAAGLAICGWDTDGDGVDDGTEWMVDRARCRGDAPSACGLAADPLRVPMDDVVPVTLPARRSVELLVAFPAGSPGGDIRPALRELPGLGRLEPLRFVRGFRPRCTWTGGAAPLPTPPCWTPPAGSSEADAVAAVDLERFFGVREGTGVQFILEVVNDHVIDAPARRVTAFDLVADARRAATIVVAIPPRIRGFE